LAETLAIVDSIVSTPGTLTALHSKLQTKSNYFLTFFNFYIGFLVPGKRNDLQCFISGECSNGQELDNLSSKNEFQCLESCQQTANCTWFSFHPDSSTCNLLSSCKTIEDATCLNCISGERECDNPKSVSFVPGIVNFLYV
jgi:hypothetical protein